MKWIRIDESGENSRSRMTKIDRKRLMNLVMGYAWNCWYMGDQMFPWEEAEKDNYRDRIESMLDGMTIG